jgi:hypothetical protein
MTPKSPSSCALYAVSRIKNCQHGIPSFTAALVIHSRATPIRRRYATQQQRKQQVATIRYTKPEQPQADLITKDEWSAKAALTLIQSNKPPPDSLNPPRSTLPPPLRLPNREQASNVFLYYFNLGRAYGNFYKEGIKAVWYNWTAAKLLRSRVRNEHGCKDAVEAAKRGLITRSEWQLLQRNGRDVGKLPFFGLLVLLFGEWLPVLVPFIPRAVPGVCHIPKQVAMMRRQAEQRRWAAFRTGTQEPKNVMLETQASDNWATTKLPYVRSTIARLTSEQLHHVSTVLTLHSSVWERLNVRPLAFLMRRNAARHLQAISVDDQLILRVSRSAARHLNQAELEAACTERGIDVLGKSEEALRESLGKWLEWQDWDKGRGGALFRLLFRR